MSEDLSQHVSQLNLVFRHEVNVVTNSVLYILNGIHGVHQCIRQGLDKIRASSESSPEGPIIEDIHFFPSWPKLRAFPGLTGEPLLHRSHPGGSMDQLVLKAWVVEVYHLWESHYRSVFKREFRRVVKDAIPPLQDVLGDLRLIRHDLIHSGAAERSGKCTILRWFKTGELMQIQLRHVLDFLNQMGWMDASPVFMVGNSQPIGRSSSWSIQSDSDVQREKIPIPDPTPPLVSVRPLIEKAPNSTAFWYGASVVFEDAVFGQIAMGKSEEPLEHKNQQWHKMRVDEEGNLNVPGMRSVLGKDLYIACMRGHSVPGPRVSGPWFQFRRTGKEGQSE